MSYSPDSFVYNLVLTLTGVKLDELTAEQAHELAQECINLYIDFITHYVQEKYSLKDSIRLRSAYESGEDVLTNFPELVPMYEEAYAAFLQWLENNLAVYVQGNT